MQHWIRKFYLAGRGVIFGVRGQSSFAVHFPMAVAVLVIAALLRCQLWQWCILILCIGLVLSAELANSALEELAAGVSPQENERVGRALDIASGAVLIASLTASAIGALIFISQLICYVSAV